MDGLWQAGAIETITETFSFLRGIPVAVFFAVLPIGAGLYAQRNLAVLDRVAVGRHVRLSRSLRVAANLVYGMYAVLVLTLFITNSFQYLRSVPLPWEAALTFMLLVLLAAMLGAVGVLAKRAELQSIRAALAERERVQRELERSNRDLAQFAYVASHDLKEPLRMVSSYTRLLQKRYAGQLDADADEFIRFAAEGADRMGAMIDDLLTYARVQSVAEREEVPLADVLEAVRAQLRHFLAEKGASLTVETLPTVAGVRSQLVQLFQNLVHNAVKFHREGVPPEVHVKASRAGDAWLVTVSDNGIGIPAKHLTDVFDVFRSLHPRDVYPGTGIGLAVCKKIVEQHNGRIWCQSEPGQGTRFHIELPA